MLNISRIRQIHNNMLSPFAALLAVRLTKNVLASLLVWSRFLSAGRCHTQRWMECVMFALKKRAKFNSVGQHIEILEIHTMTWSWIIINDDAVVDAKRLWTQKQREQRAHKNNGQPTNEGSHIHGLLLATPVHRQSLIFPARTSESSSSSQVNVH